MRGGRIPRPGPACLGRQLPRQRPCQPGCRLVRDRAGFLPDRRRGRGDPRLLPDHGQGLLTPGRRRARSPAVDSMGRRHEDRGRTHELDRDRVDRRSEPVNRLHPPLALPGSAKALPSMPEPPAPVGRLGLEGRLDVQPLRLPDRAMRRFQRPDGAAHRPSALTGDRCVLKKTEPTFSCSIRP